MGYFPEYRDDPVGFCRNVLQQKTWGRQEEMLTAPLRSRRIAIRAGHKVSKSRSFALIGWWFCCTRRDAQVIYSGPTDRQVNNILWSEVRKVARSKEHLLGAKPALTPGAGARWEDGRMMIGFTAGSASGVAGSSGANLLYLIDEASGVKEEIMTAILGNLASETAMIIIASQPRRQDGLHFEAFERRKDFLKIEISALESPNITGEPIWSPEKNAMVVETIPGLADKTWAEECLVNWGVNDVRYRVEVLGKPPEAGIRAIVPLSLLDVALARMEHAVGEGRLNLGVDVARFGDDTTKVVNRRGWMVYPPVKLDQGDGKAVAEDVMRIVRADRLTLGKAEDGETLYEVPVVKVDAIGVGASVADHLRPYGRPRIIEGKWRAAEIVLVEVISSNKSTDEDRFANLRAQLAFGVKDFLRDGGAVPKHDSLERQLLSIQYRYDTRNRLLAESKDDIKARLGESPDDYDALALAIYQPKRLPEAPKGSRGYIPDHGSFDSTPIG